MNTPTGLAPFLREFWRFDRRATLVTLGLNLTGALLEGLGLMLLLPLLHLAGVLGPDAAGGSARTGLPFSVPRFATDLIDALPPDGRLLLMLGVFVAVVVLQSGVALFRERQSLHLQLRFVDHLRDRLFAALAGARWSFLSRHHSSEFMSVLTTDVQRVGAGTMFLLHLFTQLAVLPVYLGVAFLLSPSVTALALVTCAVLWWLLRKSRDTAKAGGVVLSKANQNLFNELQEFLGALKLIKIHGEEDGYRRQFAHVVAHLREQQLGFQQVRGRSQLSFRIGGAVALATLTYAALAWAELTAASLLVLIAIFARTLPQVSSVHSGFQQLWHMAPAFDSWQRWVTECAGAREAARLSADVPPLRDGIRLHAVRYRHPQGAHVLDVPDLFLPARRTTAVIGPTGSGKTTLLDLVAGLNVPESGTIEVDGVPLAEAGWRGRIAYVPQDSAILDGTVRENLCWGNDADDDARLLEALDHAAAGAFVRQLPKGLDTWVGERGVRLSGGEKQRLALARALLRRPELLILDEATSALDREHQKIVFETLRRLHGRMTVLIVTHRFEEIRDLIDGEVRVEKVAENVSVGPWRPPAHETAQDTRTRSA